VRQDKYDWNADILKIGGGKLVEFLGGGRVTQHVLLEEIFITRQSEYLTRGLSYPKGDEGFDFSLSGLVGLFGGGGNPGPSPDDKQGGPFKSNTSDPWYPDANKDRKKFQTETFEDKPIGPYDNIPNLDGDTYSSIVKKKARYITGDNATVTSMTWLDPAEKETVVVESYDVDKGKYGNPLYFIDLRDGEYIFFQAYVEGLSETITPSWNSENYVGRSEPVYTYSNAEREISFTLKLAAQSREQQDMIYKKLDRLTSLCYPEYKADVTLNNKVRMKPPLTKFRLGELWGSTGNEMVGFIKSLSYTIPDNSPWDTTDKSRVPHYIDASIGFQVIHMEVPSLEFAREKSIAENHKSGDVPAGKKNDHTFYGITKLMRDNT
jgi:hypothetical protein